MMISENEFAELESGLKTRQPGALTQDHLAELERSIKRPEPGFIKSVAGDIAGGLIDLGEMYGRAGRALPGGEPAGGPTIEGLNDPGITSRAIKWAEDFRRKNPSMDINPNRSGLSRWFHEGVRSATTSIAAGLPGAAAGAALGGSVTANPVGALVGGLVGYATSGATMFGMAEYDQFMEEAKKANIPIERAEPAAIRSGLYEGGLEFAADLLEGATMGTGRIVTTPAKEAFKLGVGSMFKKNLKDMLIRGAGLTAIETGSEMLTGGLQTEERARLGLTEDRFMQGAIDAFGPSVVASMIFAGLGEGALRRTSNRVKTALTDPQRPVEERMQAAQIIAEGIQPTSEKVAKYWYDSAADAIQAGQPISLDAPILSDAEIDARIKTDEDFAIVAVQKAATESRKPIEQDVQQWEQSLQTTPLGDDEAASNILEKIATEPQASPTVSSALPEEAPPTPQLTDEERLAQIKSAKTPQAAEDRKRRWPEAQNIASQDPAAVNLDSFIEPSENTSEYIKKLEQALAREEKSLSGDIAEYTRYREEGPGAFTDHDLLMPGVSPESLLQFKSSTIGSRKAMITALKNKISELAPVPARETDVPRGEGTEELKQAMRGPELKTWDNILADEFFNLYKVSDNVYTTDPNKGTGPGIRIMGDSAVYHAIPGKTPNEFIFNRRKPEEIGYVTRENPPPVTKAEFDELQKSIFGEETQKPIHKMEPTERKPNEKPTQTQTQANAQANAQAQRIEERQVLKKQQVDETKANKLATLLAEANRLGPRFFPNEQANALRSAERDYRLGNVRDKFADSVISEAEGIINASRNSAEVWWTKEVPTLEAKAEILKSLGIKRPARIDWRSFTGDQTRKLTDYFNKQAEPKITPEPISTIDQQIAQATEADIDKMLDELEPKQLQTGTKTATEKITKPETALAPQRQTKKEKALKTYQDYVSGLKPETKEAVKDLIKENPQSPGSALLKLMRAVNKLPAPEQAPAPAQAALDPWQMTQEEFAAKSVGGRPILDDRKTSAHRKFVKIALEEGKPVPEKVLKDYPDLVKAAPAPAQRSAADIIKSAADLGVKGIDESIKGLFELFGGSSLKSFPAGLDPDTYAKAKPHFSKALENFRAAGKELSEFVKWAYDQFGAMVKPYLRHFLLEQKQPKVETEVKPQPQEVANADVREQVNVVAGPGIRTNGPEVSGQPEQVETGGETGREPGGEISQGVVGQRTPELAGRGTEPGYADTGGRVPNVGPAAGPEPIRRNLAMGRENRTGLNHVIQPDQILAPKGNEAKIQGNISAIELIKALDKEDRNPTPEEQAILAQYVGWGSFGQKVFTPAYDDYASKYQERYTPEKWFYKPEELKAYRQWANKYGSKLHPNLGGMLTQEEWDSARSSVQNAHYTSRPVIEQMWNLVRRLGFTQGNVLEPSAGVGHFIGMMPLDFADKSAVFAVEKDAISGRILTRLYPQASVQVTPFERSRGIAPNSMDLVISNVPFGKITIRDRRNKEFDKWSIHNYFIGRSIDAAKPGGMVVAITSSFTLDAKSNTNIRNTLSQKADLIGAIRLPNTAFNENANTEVVTDILVFRKKDSTISGQGIGHEFDIVETLQTDAYQKRIDDWNTAKAQLDEMKSNRPEKSYQLQAWRNRLAKQAEVIQEKFDEIQDSPAVNRYFIANPNMVLGEHAETGTMYRKDAYTVNPTGDLATQLAQAITTFPKNIAGQGTDLSNARPVKIAGKEKEGTLFFQNGELKMVVNGRIIAPEYIDSKGNVIKANKAAQVQKMTKYVGIKETTQNLLDLMADPTATDEQIAALQQDLTKQYDIYFKDHKVFNSVGNSFLRKMDNDFAVVDALEVPVENEEGATVGFEKAPIFTRRTVFPFQEPTKAADIFDAVNLSLVYRGEISLDYIGRILDEPDIAKVQQQVIEENLGFIDPSTGLLMQRDEYLSGNVKIKLAKAKEAALDDPAYERNVKALEPIIPEDLDIVFVNFRLGSSWIPPNVIQDFAKDVLDVDIVVNKGEDHRGTFWQIGPTSGDKIKLYSAKNVDTWGAGGKTGTELMLDNLNLKQSEIIDTIRDGTKTIQVKNTEKTAAAQLKQQELNSEFARWAKTHETHAPELTKIYNREKNGTVLRKHQEPDIDVYPNASHFDLDGVTPLRLQPHQKIAVSRALQESVLLAYGVGTGKTMIFVTIAMEMKRIGTAKKPLIVVHNSTVDQYRKTFIRLYPGAKVLIPDEQQRDAKYRKKLLTSIATGDWDAIVLPQSTFDGLANDPVRERAYVQAQLDIYREALEEARNTEGQRSFRVTELENLISNRQQRLENMLERRKDEALTFEQMGIDALLVDEVHAYKRSEFFTKMEKIKGIDNGYADRSASLLLKAQYIRDKTGGKNVITATGTPISNTMAELWTMLRYVRPDLLEEFGVSNFDDFASTFGVVVTDIERTPKGFVEVNRFQKYINGPELLSMFFRGADVRLTKDANLKLPEIENGQPTLVKVEKSPTLRAVVNSIIRQWRSWDRLTGREKRRQRHVPLVLYGTAKKAAVDLRYVDPVKFGDDPNSKINIAAKQIARIYKETQDDRSTQIVFNDLIRDDSKNPRFNGHEDLKKKLINLGVDADDIILYSMLSNEKQRDAAKEKIRTSKARVIIGTISKLGVGVDIAHNMVASHMISIPDRPMDVEQAHGRIVRQSNSNAMVQLYQYATKDTIDPQLFERLMRKQRMADQILSGEISGREFDDPFSEEQASFEQFAAESSGKAGKLLLERSKIENKLRQWQSAEQEYIRKISYAKQQINSLPDSIAANKINIEKNKDIINYLAKEFPDNNFETITFNGTEMPRKEAYKAISDQIKNTMDVWTDRFIGKSGKEFAKVAGKLSMLMGNPLELSDTINFNIGKFSGKLFYATATNYEDLKSPTGKLKWLYQNAEEKGFDGKTRIADLLIKYGDRTIGYGTFNGDRVGDITKKIKFLFGKFQEKQTELEELIIKQEKSLEEYKESINEKFKYADEIKQAQAKHDELQRELQTIDLSEGDTGIFSAREAMAEFKNGIMQLMAASGADELDLNQWRDGLADINDTTIAVADKAKNWFENRLDDEALLKKISSYIDRMAEYAQVMVDQSNYDEIIGEPLLPKVPNDIAENMAPLPEGVMRFALGNSSQSMQDVQQAAYLIRQAMADAGLPMAIQDRVKLSLAPVVDIKGADVDKTLDEWKSLGKNVNTVLGATTINGTNALVQMSLAQDLGTMERNAYHESFHLAAKWLLPEADYAKVVGFYNGNEEAAAEAFADFVEKRRGLQKTPVGVVRRAMIYMRDLIARLGNLLRGKGFSRPEDVFKDIMDGKYEPQESWSDSTSYMAEQWAAKWRSQMRDQLLKLPGKGTPQQMHDTILTWASKGLIKREELEWSSILNNLDEYEKRFPNQKISRLEVLKMFDSTSVILGEVSTDDVDKDKLAEFIKGANYSVKQTQDGKFKAYIGELELETFNSETEAWKFIEDDASFTIRSTTQKYYSFILPGGTNYNEMRIIFPTAPKDPAKSEYFILQDTDGNTYGDHYFGYGEALDAKEKLEEDLDLVLTLEYQKTKNTVAGRIGGITSEQPFVSTHWPEPNVLAHSRFQTMAGKNGEKILVIEENQSDWHQEGRQRSYDAGKWEVFNPNTAEVLHVVATEEQAKELATNGLDYSESEGVPDAPFKTSWPLLVMKRMVRYAAENGFDYIAWPNGQIQVDRYGLDMPVAEISYRLEDRENGLVPPSWTVRFLDKRGLPITGAMMTGANYGDLQEKLGKQIADKIYNNLGEPDNFGNFSTFAAPEGMTAGGEGMKEFYDVMLPNFIKNFFGKAAWGSPQVYQLKLPKAQGGWDLTLKYRQPEKSARSVEPQVWIMPITPEMRRKALTEGMTMFAMGQRDIYADTLPEEVAVRFKEARLKPETLKAKVGAFIKDTIAVFTPGNKFPTLAGPSFAAAREILRNATEVTHYAKWRAAEDLKEILQPKDLSPAQYDLFGLKIILDDMKKDLDPETGVLAGWREKHEELPFGFKSETDLDASIARADAIIAQDPKIQAALGRRERYMMDMRHQLVEAKLLNKSVLNEPRYYHHQVLEHMADRYGVGTGMRDVRVHKKGYQYHRTGSIKDYNTEYLQSEYEVLAQGISQLELKKNIDEIGNKYNVIGNLRRSAKHKNYVNVVGGPDNFKRLQALRRERAFINDPRDERSRALMQEIWMLDPTMPFRQDIAIGLSKLNASGHNFDLIEDPEVGLDMHEIAYLADQGEIGALMVLKAINQREDLIQQILGSRYLTWRDEMSKREPLPGSKGWTEWIPKPGQAWYMTNTISDKTVEQVLSGQRQIQEADIRQVLARGYDARWVLPEEVAAAMEGQDFLKSAHENPVAMAAEATLNAWKRWILLNPMRVVKYNLNNTSGDADIVFAYNPQIFKYMKQSAIDLFKQMRNKPMTRALKTEIDTAMRDGVISAGMTAQDIPDIGNLAEFDKIMTALKADQNKSIEYIKRFWNTSKEFTTWRENVLRLAAYRHFKAEIGSGKTNIYGVSDPATVNETTDLDRRAALLSRELVGDYGNISKGGQWLRRKMIPFYSWAEINAPRYWRLFKNMPLEGEASRLRVGTVLAKKGAVLTAKMMMLYTLVSAFNSIFWPEEEEELGTSGRRQLHLILGRNEDGTIQTLRIQGALSDALSWFGLEDLPEDVRELASGKKSLGEQGKEMLLAPANKIIQGLRPDIKMPAELITGRTIYPEFTEPRPIRDKTEHIARMFSLDRLYNRLAGKPSQERDFMDKVLADLGATVTYTSDPRQAAYYDTRSMAAKYLESKGIENPPTEPTSRSNALYYYRQAIKYGDGEAALKYLKDYLSMGGKLSGLRTSIERAHPLAMIPKSRWTSFMASLGPEDRRTVQRAIGWYNQTYRR